MVMLAMGLLNAFCDVVSSLPFLPRGKGSIILIQGGLVVLGFSLLWSLMTPRTSVADLTATRAPTPRNPAGRPVLFRETPRADVVVLTANAPLATGQWQVVEPASAEFELLPDWRGSALEKVLRATIGRTRLLSANPAWFILTVPACKSCRNGTKGPSGCHLETAAIAQAVRGSAPNARVTEVSCNLLGRGACTFKVERGREA